MNVAGRTNFSSARHEHHNRMSSSHIDPLLATLLQNAVFFAIASLYVAIGARRTSGTAAFPGPRPVANWFKIWLVVIWIVGLALPIAALLIDGVVRGQSNAAVALGAYLGMFVAQVATELWVWRRWRSPIWVIVPCLYLGWRLWQIVWGFQLIANDDAALTRGALVALFVLWVINIGVHFTNVPLTLRWDHHAKNATFPSLRQAIPFGKRAQDALDVQSQDRR